MQLLEEILTFFLQVIFSSLFASFPLPGPSFGREVSEMTIVGIRTIQGTINSVSPCFALIYRNR